MDADISPIPKWMQHGVALACTQAPFSVTPTPKNQGAPSIETHEMATQNSRLLQIRLVEPKLGIRLSTLWNRVLPHKVLQVIAAMLTFVHLL